jgi:hypothetical protein
MQETAFHCSTNLAGQSSERQGKISTSITWNGSFPALRTRCV